MAKVTYVTCSSCQKDYYIDHILAEALKANPEQELKCPFCKQEFKLDAKSDGRPAAHG